MSRLGLKSRAMGRIISFFTAITLVFISGLELVNVPAQEPALGISSVSDRDSFVKVLSDINIGTITVKSAIDVSSIDWKQCQKGPKYISGDSYASGLILPTNIALTESLIFENINIVGHHQNGTVIYANGFAFGFGQGVNTSGIKAVIGGADGVNVVSTNIVLQSGNVDAIYMGGTNSTVSGVAMLTLGGNALVGAVTASYANASIQGSSALILDGFGSSTGYRAMLPDIYGVDNVVLNNSFIKMSAWPMLLDAKKLTVARDSVLWFDGSVNIGCALVGDSSEFIITGGSEIALPQIADAMGGIFRLSISAGEGAPDSAVIKNAVAYRECFVPNGDTYIGTDNDVFVQRLTKAEIFLSAMPKTSYAWGEELDVGGGVITQKYMPYALGVSKDTPLERGMITGYDMTKAGDQVLAVTYNGFSTVLAVHVDEPVITSLRLLSLPLKTTYYIGEALDVAGGSLTVSYSDSTSYDIPFTDPGVKILGYSSSVASRQTLEVTYKDIPAFTYEVIVNAQVQYEESSSDSRFDIPDKDRYVDIKGIPASDTVQVGDTFTLSASPNRRGDWSWDKEYFSMKLDTNTYRATFTALKKGSSRISYSDEYAKDSALIKITQAAAEAVDDEMPVSIDPQAGANSLSSSDNGEADSAVSSSGPRARENIEASQVRTEPVRTGQDKEILPVTDDFTPVNYPVVIAGGVASISLIIAASIFVYRFSMKK